MNYDVKSVATLPFADYNGTRYCYLALETNSKLSTFGGDKKKNEKVTEGAARELQEESLGVFFKNTGKTVKKLSNPATSTQFRTGKHVTFFVKYHLKNHVKNKKPQNLMRMFDKIRKKNIKQLKPNQLEVQKIVAVKKDTLIKALKNAEATKQPLSFENHPLRGCVYQNLVAALKAGILDKA